jgi:hypothetical protein
VDVSTRAGTEVRLPPAVAALVDGTDLAAKVGHTISLIAVDDEGWPRLALLSVGEVVSTTGADLRLALYATSGTTAALTASGRALLNVVLDGTNYKIRAAVRRLSQDAGRLAVFYGTIARVDEDRVGYAEIVSGITYRLADQAAVVERWSEQVDLLRKVTP